MKNYKITFFLVESSDVQRIQVQLQLQNYYHEIHNQFIPTIHKQSRILKVCYWTMILNEIVAYSFGKVVQWWSLNVLHTSRALIKIIYFTFLVNLYRW